MSQSDETRAEAKKDPKSSASEATGLLPDRLAPGEWPILRACWRLGPGASTPAIVRETQREVLHDYRHTQTVLRRLRKKGWVTVHQTSPRRTLWSPAYSREETLRHEAGHFVRQVAGNDPGLIQLMRQALDDLEAAESSDTAGFLPHLLRVRLIDFLDSFLAFSQYRQPLAEALAIPPLPLAGGTGSTLSDSIKLLTAAAGDRSTGALRLLRTIRDLTSTDDIPTLVVNELDSLIVAISELADESA